MGDLVEVLVGSKVHSAVCKCRSRKCAAGNGILAEDGEALAWLDPSRLAVFVQEQNTTIGENRRRRIGSAKPLHPAAIASLRVDARRDPFVRNEVELVADQ